uniref:CSON007758 protein n=1 Tax=Culicoides sonorensis TaxID=179676 RepID=A0A336N6Q7_CULSO
MMLLLVSVMSATTMLVHLVPDFHLQASNHFNSQSEFQDPTSKALQFPQLFHLTPVVALDKDLAKKTPQDKQSLQQ